MAGNNASGGAHMLSYIINAFVYFDFDNHFNATDGTVWAPWASDEYREAVKLMAQWYKEGLIAQHCFTGIESTDFKPIVTPDDEVAVVGIFAGHSSVYMNADNKVFYEYEGLEPIYVGETEEGGYLVSRAGVVYEGSQISVDAENLETAIRFVDFIYRDETTASFRHGIKGTNWDWLDPNETDDNVDNIKVLDDGQAFFQGVWTWGGNTSTIFTNNNYLNGGEAGSEWLKYEQKWYREITSWMLDPKQPEEIARDFMFTAEEQEIYNSHQQVFKDYINEGLAKFGTGVWDPNSDADWNNYLAELDALGLETYLGTVQSGYTKYLETYGK
jgi:putative aldouronate transport system substrate-binding protein